MNFSKPSIDPRRAVEVLAYWFYGIAAIGSSIGQIWAMAAAPIWPHTIDIWIRVAAVSPFAVVIDLAGVVTSAFADTRRRLGEAAYGWRALSLFSVAVAVGINIAGHRDTIQYAVAFGFLGVLAYTIWLLHSAARRRDALRAQSKLADTAPVYGPWQWATEFEITRLARQLALSRGLGLYESLNAAREQIRVRTRNAAFAKRIETLVRAMHHDPIRAEIAVTGMNLNTIADTTANLIDNNAWAAYIAADLNPPTAANTTAASSAALPGLTAVMPADALRTVPSKQDEYDRWRQIWEQIRHEPKTGSKALADRLGIGLRTVQRIRAVGPTGLLDDPAPPAIRLAQLAIHNQVTSLNGHQPGEPIPASA